MTDPAAGAARRPLDLPWALLRAMRPLQWTKNAVVRPALVFASRLSAPSDVAAAVLAMLVFCGLSSAVYL
ncbi:MAG: decaprenyl-phosphate phosphoribosyltransferase, partial [Chloroflexota bacterium]